MAWESNDHYRRILADIKHIYLYVNLQWGLWSDYHKSIRKMMHQRVDNICRDPFLSNEKVKPQDWHSLLSVQDKETADANS